MTNFLLTYSEQFQQFIIFEKQEKLVALPADAIYAVVGEGKSIVELEEFVKWMNLWKAMHELKNLTLDQVRLGWDGFHTNNLSIKILP